MTYGIDRLVPDDNAAAEPVGARVGIGFAAWRKLDDQSRLRLVERELKPANDFIDSYPLAL